MMDREEHEGKNLEQKQRKRLKASDEQLLKELEEAEKSIKDTDFPGVEERLFRRLMERKAAEEAAAKKKAQIRRRHRVMVVALAAVFMMALGFTAVGEKSYFFRRTEEGDNHLIMDNDNNKIAVGKLEEACLTIEETFNIKIPRLGYRPEGLKFDELNISGDTAIIVFEYKGNKVHFMQEHCDTSTSRGANSDRENVTIVYNDWLKTNITITSNKLESDNIEYGAEINIGSYIYRLIGIMDENEFKEIVKNIYFFE